jgi:hypothetical protein
MRKTAREIQKEELERRYAALIEDYHAAYNQLNSSVDEVDIRRIKRRIQVIEEEMSAVWTSLEALDTASPGSRHKVLEEHLPKIDFKEAVEITKERLGLGGREGNAAVFLIQNSHAMGGVWCISRMQSLLREETREVKHYPVGFSAEGQVDEWGFLSKLASHVGVVGDFTDLTDYTWEVIRKILDGLTTGSTAVIEVSRWDFVHPQGRVLNWLVNDFWIPFVRELTNILQSRRKVRLMLIITVESEIPREHLPPTICCVGREELHTEKIIELALQNWTRDEIKEWLECFTELDGRQIDQVTDIIYGASQNGVPSLVHSALLSQVFQGAKT